MALGRTVIRLELPALGVCVLTCLAAGGLGSAFTAPAIGAWYAGLNKPSFNPPNWIFGPVWTTLYVLMAVAAWRVWRQRAARPVRLALWLFGVQLALNAAWSPIFFGLHRPLAAMIDLAMLWVALVVTLVVFWRVDRTAGFLLLPYLAWVSFAGVLNAALVVLN
jgi:translocator protein